MIILATDPQPSDWSCITTNGIRHIIECEFEGTNFRTSYSLSVLSLYSRVRIRKHDQFIAMKMNTHTHTWHQTTSQNLILVKCTTKKGDLKNKRLDVANQSRKEMKWDECVQVDGRIRCCLYIHADVLANHSVVAACWLDTTRLRNQANTRPHGILRGLLRRHERNGAQKTLKTWPAQD